MIDRKLLASATMAHLNAEGRQALQELLPPAPDRDRLIHLAIEEGLAGLFYKNFLKAGVLENLTGHQQEKLRAYYYATVRFNLKLTRDFTEILRRLNQQRIDVVLLQGVDLLCGIYTDIGLRPLTDIDLWVRKNDLPAVESILEDLDYRKDPAYPLTFRKASTLLDLHCHLLWADRIRARKHLLSGEQDQIFHHTRTLSLEGLTARSLDPYDRIIYLGLHLLKHNAQRLIWLVDIQNLVADWKSSDWEALLARAQARGQSKCIAYTFFLVGRLLEWHMPEELRAELAPLNPIEKKILKLRTQKEILPEWSTLILFSAGRGFAKGSRVILETLFPRPEILEQVFAEAPGAGVSRLYLRRMLQLIKIARASWK